MAEFNYEELLEKARKGLPREELASVMPYITDVNDDFENPIKLRLLGNAIANSPANASVLQSQPEAIERLLTMKSLGPQILYNGCVQNKAFSEMLMNFPGFIEQLEPDVVSRNLVGAMLESLGSDTNLDFEARLAVRGFIELIVNNPELEVHPLVLENFARVYGHCQSVTQVAATESSDFDDKFSSLGNQVVGNISSHSEFGLDRVKDVPAEPFTWDTVALLANLTVPKAQIEAVMQKWPDLVSKTVELIKEEDPEDDENKKINIIPVRNPHTEETDDEDELREFPEEDRPLAIFDEPPFDVVIWGSLFRNISRYAPAAKQIAQHEPAKLVSRILSVPVLQEVAWDFASIFAAHVYDHDLVELATESPFSGGSVLFSSAAAQGMLESSEISSEEVAWATPRLVRAIREGLTQTDMTHVWIKGTRALTILKAAHPNIVTVDVEQLAKEGPVDSAVQNNLEALKVTDQHS